MIVSKRHKKTGLRIKVTRKISEIPAHDWKKVYPDVLENYDFFRTIDSSGITQFSFYYIIVYDKNHPVGATACFLVDYSLDTSINGPLRRITNSIKRLKPNIFSIKTLVCGVPMAQGKIGLAGDKSAVFKAMLRKMDHIAKKSKASIVAFKDFDGPYTEILDPLQRAGFAKFDSLPNTELNVWHKDFEEYLKTLSGATRYDLRRKFKKVDGHVKIDLKIVDSLEADEMKAVYKMYLEIVSRHDMNFELLPEDFFRDISVNMPGRAKFFLWKIDGKIVAFLFSMVSQERFIDYFVGLDYSVAHKYHLYFLKFREALIWCIKHKIKKYEMGITAYEPKLRLGFDLVPLYIYAKLRNRMLRPAFNLICQFLKFEHFDPVLRAAKKKAGI
ncbi:MAG: GNAT family N-acetyltransferase [Candidatus Omnitrophica bacterium]|nr:GNAT family N-acetyltransferase [Candidatus Omnitrophota bacterium]